MLFLFLFSLSKVCCYCLSCNVNRLIVLVKCENESASACFLYFQGGISYQSLLRDVYGDLMRRLLDLSSGDNIFISQPCRDNTLYLLRLIDEMLLSEIYYNIPVINVVEYLTRTFLIVLHLSICFRFC